MSTAAALLDPDDPDGALWQRLGAVDDPYAFGAAWLAAVAALVGPVDSAVLTLRMAPTGRLLPAATLPQGQAVAPDLVAATEAACARRLALLRDGPDHSLVAAMPYMQGEQVLAVIALRLRRATDVQRQSVLRHLNWAGGWVRLHLAQKAPQDSMAQPVLDQVADILAARGFADACRTLVTGLATAMGADRVSLVWVAGRAPRLIAVSNSADFSPRRNLSGTIVSAATEAVDQSAVLHSPRPAQSPAFVTRALDALLQQSGATTGLALPLFVNGKAVCALLAETSAPSGFRPQAAAFALATGTAIASALEEKRRAGASLVTLVVQRIGAGFATLVGPDKVKLKLAALAVVLLGLAAATVKTDFTIVADASLEGQQIRWIVAPYDGYIATVSARPGAQVAAGAGLVSLDKMDLTLERLGRIAELNRKEIEINIATGKGDRGQINQLRAEMQYEQANIALLDANIARADMRAPFDALVVSGDLTDRLGAPVRQGDKLLSLSPAGGVRVHLSVRDQNLDEVHLGQTGTLRMTALPGQDLPVRVVAITPVTQIDNGQNVFAVEAALTGDPANLTPGMKGVARLDVDRRLLVSVWTRPITDWLSMAVWTWWP